MIKIQNKMTETDFKMDEIHNRIQWFILTIKFIIKMNEIDFKCVKFKTTLPQSIENA